jgi:hypothetical protein
MMWYHLIFSDNKKAVGYAWNLMGFVAKLAQGVCGIFCKLIPISLTYLSDRFAYVIMSMKRERTS